MDNREHPAPRSATLPHREPTSSGRTPVPHGSEAGLRGPGPGPRGSGPGVITPDGCSVELYGLLPSMGEPEIVHDAIPPGASILELGPGRGG